MKMKLLISYVILILLAVPNLGRCQQTNNWYFGSAAGFPNTGLRVDFSSGSPVVSTGYPLMTEEGSSSISDPLTGDPLFYTDGVNVWSGTTNATVTGGTGLLGNSSTTQSAIVMPISTTKWLIFTNGATGAGVNYYTVTGPAPFTVSGATNLAGANVVGEGLTVIGSTKGGSSAFWVVARDIGATGGVRSWEVSNTGVVTAAPVTSTLSGGSYSHTSYTSKIGTIKSNTCQNQLAFTYLNDRADITDFNASTGQVTAGTAKAIAVTSGGGDSGSYGIEFSPNDDYLYITNLAGGQVYRHIVGGAGAASIGTTTASAEAGQLQLGPDGVIYMARRNSSPSTGSSYLSTISNPDGGGTFTELALLLTGVTNGSGNTGFAYRGLPTFPKSLVVTNPVITRPSADTTVCRTSSITFDYIYGGSIKSPLASNLKWEIFENSTTATATYNSLNPTHSFNTLPTVAGTPFKVRVTITDECNRIWKDSVNVTVVSPKTPAGTISCTVNSLVLNNPAVDVDEPKYVWYNGTVAGGKIIGIGTPVSYTIGNNSAMPSQICIGVASSATQTVASNKTIASTNTLSGASEATPKTSPTFDVLADNILLKSFNTGFRFGTGAPGYNLTVTIKQGATTVYSNNFNTGAVTGGANYTVNVNTTLPKGNGYTITIASSPTGLELQRGTWAGLTNAGEIRYNGEAFPGTTSIANLLYNAYTYNVSPTCTTPTCITPACTLPVELIAFNGNRQGGHVVLTWTTGSEINNDYFVLERSADGINFEPIAKIKGKGTTNESSQYNYIDNNSSSSITYYRLVQYDFNGAIQTESPIAVEASQIKGITVFPNPSAENFNITIPEVKGVSTITVLDVLGRVIYSKEITQKEKEIMFGDGWISGHYILQWITESNSQSVHLIKD